MNKKPVFSVQAMEMERQSRFDPLPNLTPATLTAQIDQFHAGNLRSLALTMEAIEERDDLLASVVPKSKAAPTVHGWEINVMDTDSEEMAEKAAAQKEKLEYFYNNLRCTSAVDRDLLGGTSVLLEQMMDAKGKRYSVHNIVWKAEPGGNYSATLWHVPLWFFEATTGKLRFLREPQSVTGEDMEEGAWLVTVGRGLMIACAVAWMYKRLPLRDWLLYCSRHGLPGFEGVTDAVEGSADFQKLTRAVRAAAGGEFAWVRSHNQEINKIDFGADGDLPFPELVDRMDRSMSAIWRGGDLSTMSKDKQAIGSEGQEGEGELIEAKDAQWLTEQCNFRLDRLVINYAFGPDEPLLAYFTVKTAQKQDVSMDLRIDKFALSNGHPISRKQFAERYNRPEPGEEDELLEGKKQGEQKETREEVTDAINEATVGSFASAVANDLLPTSKRLVALLGLNDGEAFRSQAQALRAALPGLVGQSGESAADQIEEILAGSFLAGTMGEEFVPAINSFDPTQRRDAWGRWAKTLAPHTEGSGFSGRGAAVVFTQAEMIRGIDQAMADAEAGVQSSHSLGRVPEAVASRVLRETGREIAGMEIRMDSDFVSHARAYHPNLTDDDFRRIPDLFDAPDLLVASETKQNLPAVEFRRQIESRDYLLVGAQLNGRGQVQLTTLKKSSRK